MTRPRWPVFVYAAAVAALWPVPVFGVLHAESSAVVAGLAFFVSALAGIEALRRGRALGQVARRHVSWLAVPLAGLTLGLLWRPNCAYATGLGLFALFTVPSALLGTAVAGALVAARVRRARLAAVGGGVLWAVGGAAWDLGFHPQLFTYNAVFGGVLGPIYDAELSLRPGLFVARFEALVAAGALAAFARWRGGSRRAGAACALLSAVLVVAALFAVPLGANQSRAGIERVLSQSAADGRAVVHVSPATAPREARLLAETAAFRLEQVEARLGARASETVHVYLYPDAETKGRLIGSRETSVTPVWLAAPQVHMLEDEVGRSLGHEMAHVVAREFGMPVLRASPAVGLVEGLAVAVEPPDGGPSAQALVAAGLGLPGDAGGLSEHPARVVRGAMSPLGFWTGRAAVSYNASGAFVGWLAETHGMAVVRRAYRTGRVAAATGVGLDTLTARWAAHVQALPTDAEARQTAAYLFRQPSLFEVDCPHHVPAYVRDTRLGALALDDGDASAAAEAFSRALAARPDFAPALAGALAAEAGRVSPALARTVAAAAQDTAASALTLRAAGDAAALRGAPALARAFYARARTRLAPTDRASRLALRLRARLGAAPLRTLLASSADPGAAAARLAEAPLFAALLWDDAGEPVRADAAIRRVFTAGLPADERGALRLVQARLAYRAGDVPAAGRLAGLAQRDLRAGGANALARVAADLRARVRWRLARGAAELS